MQFFSKTHHCLSEIELLFTLSANRNSGAAFLLLVQSAPNFVVFSVEIRYTDLKQIRIIFISFQYSVKYKQGAAYMLNFASIKQQKGRCFFYLLLFAVFGWTVFMQFFGADERSVNQYSDSLLYTGSFVWEKTDGTVSNLTVPGQYDVPVGETMTIVSQLPADFTASTIGIRSSMQDVRIFVGDELRVEYNTEDTRLVGKNSASRYVFCPTSAADAGTELRIELTTHTANYSGVVNQVYCGDRFDIWQSILERYEAETIIAFFLLFTGLAAILFSFMLGLAYHTVFDMEYLGWCMVVGAAWMLAQSKLRQVLFPNASSLSSLCFVLIMLSPLPVLLYADNLQKHAHHRLYLGLGILSVLSFAVSSILAAAGIADYIETLPVSQLILAVVLLLVFGNLFLSLRASKKHTDRLLLFGMVTAILCIFTELLSVYIVVFASGLFLGIGMLILLLVNILRTILYIRDIEKQRRQAEVLRSRKQAEMLSLQMIQTLSATIEAKNEYTRGHSLRVAEYAARIALELGWEPDRIQNLKYAASLHDIGKTGIPDTILNKPARLTPDEYALIQKHTVIGAEILKNIAFVPHAVDIARYHHERYDGSGYPDGLSGENIPIEARIVAISDSYDAMNSRRIYRNALSSDKIREEIRRNRGTQFDPQLTDLFLGLLDRNELPLPASGQIPTGKPDASSFENALGTFLSSIVTTMKNQEDSGNYDFLTGLPLRHLGERLIAALMQEHDGFLVFIDMDNLKKINDLYGHKAGDRALKLLGSLLSDYKKPSIACRLGGDEFLLFVPDSSSELISEQMTLLFDRFRSTACSDPELKYASLSAGLCICSKNDRFEDCYTKADKALYYVKQSGKNQFFFYQQISNHDLTSSGTAKDLALVAKALKESGSYEGALDLNYREFARHYEYVNQLGIRYQHHCYLIMVTLECTGDSVPIEETEKALECLEQAIRQKIRRVDICSRYSSMQYLIILFEPEESQIPNVMERIFRQYCLLYDRHGFLPSYEYLAMETETADGSDTQ